VTANPIQHVIVLMLENRSFDHLLAYSGIGGLTGVDTSKSNPDSAGRLVSMSENAPDRAASDPGHEFEDVDFQIYGNGPWPGPIPRPTLMNGFAIRGGPDAMGCASPERVSVLTQLAKDFLVCDNWFSSMPGPTWPNRFFGHAGSSGGLSNSPSNLTTIGSVLWSELGFSFEHGSVFDALTKGGRTWRVYHGDEFPQVCAIEGMPSMFVASADQFRRNEQLAADMLKGDVADYTLIEPNYGILSSFRDGDSQHPLGTLSAGETLIASVASAVMTSPAWQSSMLIILYDEHGGFYDQVAPPGVIPPGDEDLNSHKAANPPAPAFRFDRCGVRVPAVIVSPWVKSAAVDHTPYDHSAVVRTLFDVFKLSGQLTNRDGKAASLVLQLENAAQKAAPVVPTAAPETAESAIALAGSPRYVHSLDGFARIAAQVHHALREHEVAPSLSPRSLHAQIEAADPDLSNLDLLPKADSADESRAYIKHVADLMANHRQKQQATKTT
jgi:phospholipase C